MSHATAMSDWRRDPERFCALAARRLHRLDPGIECLIPNLAPLVAASKRTTIVKRPPKTRSGRIPRATLRAIVDGETYDVPATIDGASILEKIAAVVGSEAAG